MSYYIRAYENPNKSGDERHLFIDTGLAHIATWVIPGMCQKFKHSEFIIQNPGKNVQFRCNYTENPSVEIDAEDKITLGVPFLAFFEAIIDYGSGIIYLKKNGATYKTKLGTF